MMVQKLRGSGYSEKGREKRLILSIIRAAMTEARLIDWLTGRLLFKKGKLHFLHSGKLARGGDG